jgi:CheY-like chemotaxis protein
MPKTPESKALRRVVEACGTMKALSHWLKVPSAALIKWINGDGLPPKSIYLQGRRFSRQRRQGSRGSKNPSLSRQSDDERDTLMTLGILLRSEAFDVRLVRGGGDVPSAVREFRPHAVLLDLGMPDRSGYEVATELTQKYGSARPILIAVTAHSGESDKLAAEIFCGFHHHVSKPYKAESLLGLLASLRKNPDSGALGRG